ncbi:uncharacterized protein RAG0_13280 [Rhynchosporium agropyri]|uniref:MYND-type domain-containing protein n=1 Tax=Rhynchosporium agropyri TaxID=914238 RepID=A0A1E1LC01_9HELO|nr:uncharacterized protein RAG0_13280 [Rhynchosporium agropyri]
MASPYLRPMCARCGRNAELTCSGCKNAPPVDGDVKIVYYCSPKCQKEDWQHDKGICKRLQTRKGLYRAGSVLQEIFYMYREKLYEKFYVKIEKSEGRLVLYEGQYSLSTPFITAPTDCLIPFPETLCQTAEDKKSILVHLSCDDASAWLHEVLMYILVDIAVSIEEVRCVPKNKKLVITHVHPDQTRQDPNFEHEIIKVKLQNGGEEYALDFSGAQDGYFEPVIPWWKYVESRVANFASRQGFDYFGGLFDILRSMSGRNNVVEILLTLNVEWSRALLHGTKSWEAESKIGICSMLKLPFPQFKIKEKLLVDHIASKIVWYHERQREKKKKARVKVGYGTPAWIARHSRKKK